MQILRAVFLVFLLLFFVSKNVGATETDIPRLCVKVGEEQGIDGDLLRAIVHVESSSRIFALNREGSPIWPENKTEALEHIQWARKKGMNVDVGLGQISSRWHPEYDPSDMLNPEDNLRASASILAKLLEKNSLLGAVAAYHVGSRGDYITGRKYAMRVMQIYFDLQKK